MTNQVVWIWETTTSHVTIYYWIKKNKEYYLLYETSDNEDTISKFSGDVSDTGFCENEEPKLTTIYVIHAPVSSFLHSNTFTSLDTAFIKKTTPIRMRKTKLKNVLLYNDPN